MTEIIFKARVGSHLFGTSTPTSDVDIKGVFIPSVREILKYNTISHINLGTGSDKQKNTADDVDEEYYALHKFLGMIAKGDMVATEMLFAQGEIVSDSFSATSVWAMLYRHRHKILSRECKGFVGYVQRQASVYSVKGDRLNEVNDTIYFLERLQQTWPKAKKLCEVPGFRDLAFNFAKIKTHVDIEFVDINHKTVFHFICCDRKVPDTVTFKEALAIYTRVRDEYGHRAQKAASNQGHDWKALSHAIRVGEEAIELLSTEQITFPRPNAKYLLDIKLGNVEYLKVAEQMQELLGSVESHVKLSPLPELPDYEFIEEFYTEIYGKKVFKEFYNE